MSESSDSNRMTPAVQVLRRLIVSPLFKLTVILYMLTAVYNIVLIIQDRSFFYQYIAMLQRTMEEMLVLPSGILIHVTQGIYAMGPVVVVLIFVPEVLRFLGMMMLGISVDKLQGPTRETGGLSILQAAFILEGVFYTLIDLLITGIIFLGMLGEIKTSQMNGGSAILYTILFLAAAAAAVLIIAYTVNMSRTIRSIRATMRDGEVRNGVSLYVILINLIMSVILAVASLQTFHFTEVGGMLVSGVGIAILLLITLGLAWYRKQMQILAAEKVQIKKEKRE